MLQKLIQDWSRLSLFGRSKTIGGWDGLYWTVTDEALTNVVTPSVVIPYPSWICPKMWYLGLTRDCMVCKRLRHPALSFEIARSPWPKGGLWVTRMSMPSGILFHISWIGWPRGFMKAQSQNTGDLQLYWSKEAL